MEGVKLNNKQQLIEFLSTQTEIQEIFTILKQQQINEAVLTAGAVRNLVWDKLTQQKYNILQENIDILFADQSLSYEKLLTKKAIINQKYSKYLWNIQNVRQNNAASHQPFGNSVENALMTIPETCSAVGISISKQGEFEILAPFGLDDLFNLEVHPNPTWLDNKTKMAAYQRRLNWKNWTDKWPNLKVYTK